MLIFGTFAWATNERYGGSVVVGGEVTVVGAIVTAVGAVCGFAVSLLPPHDAPITPASRPASRILRVLVRMSLPIRREQGAHGAAERSVARIVDCRSAGRLIG